MTHVTFTLRGRNPDVLTCIANLSNDEVFTQPEIWGENSRRPTTAVDRKKRPKSKSADD